MTIEEFRLKKQQMLNSSPSKSGTTRMTMDEFRAKKEKILSGKSEEPQYNFTPEDANTMKNLVNSRIAISNAINYPKIVAEKQAEKAEQERLANLSAGEKFVEGWEKLEQTPVLKGINTVGAVASSVLGGIVSGTEDLLKSGVSTALNVKSRMLKNDIANKEKAVEDAINKAIEKGNYTEEQKEELKRAGKEWLNQNTSKETQEIYNTEELSKELQKKNYTRETLQPIIQEDVNKSYLPQKGSELLQGVGNIIPSLYTGAKVVGALNAPSQIVSTLPFLAQSSQAGTTRALEEGATLEQAEKYGLASGAAETAVELLSGGIGGAISNKIATKLGGKVFSKATMDKIANNVVGKYALKLADLGLDMTAEGLEEVASDIIDPYLQRATYNELAELSTNESRLQSFLDGALSTFILRSGMKLSNIGQNVENVSETASAEKNFASELPTIASQQAMLPTNQTEGKTVQNGNIEQIAETSKMPANFMQNRPTYEVEIEKILPFASEGGYRETAQVENLRKNIQQNGIKKPIEIMTNSNGEVVINDGNHRLQIAKELGIKNIPVQYLDGNSQKTIEADTFTGYNTPVDERWDSDVNGTRGTIGGQNQGSRLAEEDSAYNGVLSDRTNTTAENDKLLGGEQGYNNRPSSDTTRGENIAGQTINEADTQSAFSMPKNYIDPTQDIQKATEFVSKATVEDIDTLNKMAEEAEKYPDRLDLQFFAEKAREAIEKLSRQQVRQAIMEETGVESYNLDDVNKISKAKMNFATPVRVIEKIFNKETANKINDNFFKPIKHNEAERIRRLNKERNDIKELDIKPGSAEDAAIQKYGEGEYVDENGLTIPYTLENLKRDFPDTWQKLQNATNVIRNKYDTYLEEINEVLKDNGYDPIPKRKDYFRHFEELNDLFSILGVPTKVDDIPTDLNGMTADLKPGKQFFANALQRKGNKTTYSAIKGIDGYLDGAMNILYHTKDIQKLRTLDKYIRDTYGQTKGLAEASTMTDEQKAKRINQINEGHLSEFAAWLTEYTNALAGKKSRLDRGIEEMFGRKAYKYLNLIKKQVGANMTGLNVNSALSNFISVTQAAPKTNKKALVKGTIDTVKNIFENDGFIDKSDFLTTRFGTDKLAKNWWQKAGDVGQIFMSATDYFTANLITRSKYQEFLDKGYTEAEAIKKADEFADRLMAGRGKGDLPNAFESKMLGIVTQFQLEVTNQLDSIFYDTLHEDYAAESNSKLAKEHPKFYNAASATFILGQIFALAFLYNEGKEELTGTEGGALDPIGTIADAMKYLTDPNITRGEAIAMMIEDIADQLPFASIITGGGRLPIKDAFVDWLALLRGEANWDELWKFANLLLPTGGGQVKKAVQGLSTYAKGGSYSKDAEGKDKLKYPVEQNAINLVKSALFGKWSTPGARDYIDRGFKPLSANQTEAYNKATKAGISSDDFFKVYDATRGIESDKDRNGKTIENSKSKKLKEAIDKATPKLSSSQRKILYDAFNVSKTVQGGNGLPTASDFKVTLPKANIKIEK